MSTSAVQNIKQLPPSAEDEKIVREAFAHFDIKQEYKLTKESRRKLAIYLRDKYAWTEQRIAIGLKVSQQQINHDLSELLPKTSKSSKTRGRKPGSKTPREKLDAALRSRQQGKTQTEAAKDAGLNSVQSVKIAEAYEQGQTDLLNQLDIDPKTLSVSAKAKLEANKRIIKRTLESEYAERVRNLDEEVRQRVLTEGKEYLMMLKEREEEAEKTIALYKEWTNDGKQLFTMNQFRLLQKCLHDGGRAAKPAEFNEAFHLITSKKFQLTGKK